MGPRVKLAESLLPLMNLRLILFLLGGCASTALALAGQSVAVTGVAYDYAKPTVASTLALGNVRTNTAATLGVANTVITNALYQDSLAVAATTTLGNVLVASPANIAAGQSDVVGLPWQRVPRPMYPMEEPKHWRG